MVEVMQAQNTQERGMDMPIHAKSDCPLGYRYMGEYNGVRHFWNPMTGNNLYIDENIIAPTSIHKPISETPPITKVIDVSKWQLD